MDTSSKDRQQRHVADEDTCLKIDDVVRILKVPKTTVKILIAKGEIPSFKIGRHRRFLAEDVTKWLRKQTA